MSDASAGLWVTGPDAYRRKMFDLVVGRDPLQIMSQTPEALRRIVAAHALEDRPASTHPGKWTLSEIIGHLVDTEFVFGFRTRLVLCEDQPEIVPMDQGRWVAGQGYCSRGPGELTDEFRSLREINLRLWRRMTPADLKRTGRHGERGLESLGTLLVMIAGHDLGHLDDVQRYWGTVA